MQVETKTQWYVFIFILNFFVSPVAICPSLRSSASLPAKEGNHIKMQGRHVILHLGTELLSDSMLARAPYELIFVEKYFKKLKNIIF